MPQFRVLHVDDEPDFGTLVATFIEREDARFDVRTATGAADALERLDGDVDCVVSDYDMPGMNGLELLDAVRADYPDLPFILFTGKGSEEIASEAISRGVTDYLQKETGTDQYAVLANRLRNEIERFRSNEALKQREESLARAQRIANLGNWDWHLATDDLFWSDQIYHIFGVDPATFAGSYEAFLEFVHPDDRLDVQRAVDAALDDDVPYDIEHRIVRADGTERLVRERGEIRLDDEGEPAWMSGTVQDITDQTERRRDIQRYKAAVEAIEAGICTIDSDGTVEVLNQRAADIFDVPVKDREAPARFSLSDAQPLRGEAGSTIERTLDALFEGAEAETSLPVRPAENADGDSLELTLRLVQPAARRDRVVGFIGRNQASD